MLEFEVIGLIGQGGFSYVYLAQDHSLQRVVALKEYMPAALSVRLADRSVSARTDHARATFEAGLRSFVNEARLLAQFDHPALVKVYRFWEGNGTAYMAMPFYEGITLKHAIDEQIHTIDENWLKGILGPIVDALDVLHAAHCYHRDISPDNILLLSGGAPLLLDFGAARRIVGGMTQGLTVIIKPGYAPLEQYSGESNSQQGPWTDIYALSAVLYFAITGKAPTPSVARTLCDTLVSLRPSMDAGYSQGFLTAIESGLAVQPAARPQSMDEFRQLLGLPTPTNHYKPAQTLASATDQARREWSQARAVGSAAGHSSATAKTVVSAAQHVESDAIASKFDHGAANAPSDVRRWAKSSAILGVAVLVVASSCIYLVWGGLITFGIQPVRGLAPNSSEVSARGAPSSQAIEPLSMTFEDTSQRDRNRLDVTTGNQAGGTESAAITSDAEGVRLENEAWGNANKVGSKDAYARFIQRFPNGAHAKEARAALQRLSQPVTNLSKTTRRADDVSTGGGTGAVDSAAGAKPTTVDQSSAVSEVQRAPLSGVSADAPVPKRDSVLDGMSVDPLNQEMEKYKQQVEQLQREKEEAARQREDVRRKQVTKTDETPQPQKKSPPPPFVPSF